MSTAIAKRYSEFHELFDDDEFVSKRVGDLLRLEDVRANGNQASPTVETTATDAAGWARHADGANGFGGA